MLDVLDFIASRGGDPKKVRESQRRRFAPEDIVDEIIALWEDHRKTNYEASQLNSKLNAVQKQIGQLKKAKSNADKQLQEKADLEKQKKQLEELVLEKEKKLNLRLKTIGNYVHDSVPVSDDEENNGQLKHWAPEGVKVEKRDCMSHHEVLTRIDGYDWERGVKIAGHRGYCLTGYGLFLNLALVNYGLEFLFNKGYKPNQPPYFMSREYMARTAQLEQFDEELYKLVEGPDSADKYLIATSEQPLSAIHDSEWMQEKDLPIKYDGKLRLNNNWLT